MQVTDVIADMLTRIRNASSAKHESVDVPASNLKRSIANILRDEGYVKDVQEFDDGKQGVLRIVLKYSANKQPLITGIKRISKPGLRVYAEKDKVPKVLNGIGVAIMSTSKGVITDREARKQGIGGEVLAFVW